MPFEFEDILTIPHIPVKSNVYPENIDTLKYPHLKDVYLPSSPLSEVHSVIGTDVQYITHSEVKLGAINEPAAVYKLHACILIVPELEISTKHDPTNLHNRYASRSVSEESE